MTLLLFDGESISFHKVVELLEFFVGFFEFWLGCELVEAFCESSVQLEFIFYWDLFVYVVGVELAAEEEGGELVECFALDCY